MKRITLTLSSEVFDKVSALARRLKVSRNEVIYLYLEGSTHLRKAVSFAAKKARKTRKTCAHFSRPKGSTNPAAMGETNAEAQRRGGKEAAR